MNHQATHTSPNYKSAAGEQTVMALYDKLLAGWPVPYTTVMLPTRHGNTHVIASGPAGAPPVLLLHGAASNALAWTGDVAALSQNLRVYAVDLPGEVGRSAPNRPQWVGPAYVEWLEDVLAGLSIEHGMLPSAEAAAPSHCASAARGGARPAWAGGYHSLPSVGGNDGPCGRHTCRRRLKERRRCMTCAAMWGERCARTVRSPAGSIRDRCARWRRLRRRSR